MRLSFHFISALLITGCSVYDQALLDGAMGGDGDALGGGDGDGDTSSGGDDSGNGGSGNQNGDGDLTGGGGSQSGGSDSGGSGGSDSGGTAGAGGTGTGGFPVGTESMMDDFGPPPAYINQVDGRFGAWAVYTDDTGGVMTPGPGDPFETEAKDGDINNQALHIVAQGFTDWGAGLYVNINSPSGTPEPYDLLARGYDAIRFIAKKGEPDAHNILRIALADEHSTTAGSCAEPCAQDHPTTQVLLTDSWAEHTILLSNMNRAVLPTAPDFSAIYEFHLNMDSDNIDFWIDDIRFVDFE